MQRLEASRETVWLLFFPGDTYLPHRVTWGPAVGGMRGTPEGAEGGRQVMLIFAAWMV
jgi:hypothetical protein